MRARICEHIEKSCTKRTRAKRPEPNQLIERTRIEMTRRRPRMDFTFPCRRHLHTHPVRRLQKELASVICKAGRDKEEPRLT